MQERDIDDVPKYDPLDGGAVQAELTGDDGMYIAYHVYEVDDVTGNEFAGTRFFAIQPDGFVGTEWNHLTFDDDGNCEARISAYISQSLVRPGL